MVKLSNTDFEAITSHFAQNENGEILLPFDYDYDDGYAYIDLMQINFNSSLSAACKAVINRNCQEFEFEAKKKQSRFKSQMWVKIGLKVAYNQLTLKY